MGRAVRFVTLPHDGEKTSIRQAASGESHSGSKHTGSALCRSFLEFCPPPAVHPVGIWYVFICQRVPEQNEASFSILQLWVTISPVLPNGRRLKSVIL